MSVIVPVRILQSSKKVVLLELYPRTELCFKAFLKYIVNVNSPGLKQNLQWVGLEGY